MYGVWIAPIFIMGTLWGRPQTKPTEKMEGGKGEKDRRSKRTTILQVRTLSLDCIFIQKIKMDN